jgi:hypothetical protein
MAYLICKRIGTAALIGLMVVCMAHPALASTITLSGTITGVSEIPPPEPFEETAAGSTWTLIYTFDPDTQDVDPSGTAGQYRNNITSMTLTIGSSTVSGPPGQALPNDLESEIFVNLNPNYVDYSALMSLPDSTAWVQVSLSDSDGTPFDDDSLPQELPAPLDITFPDQRQFFLREAEAQVVSLQGEIDCIAWVRVSQVRADLQANKEGGKVDLLVDSQLFDMAGGVAKGNLTNPVNEVMGVEPSPFIWLAVDSDGEPVQDGTAAVSFLIDPVGEVSGVEPSPFRILLSAGSEILGELDFSDVSGSFPGVLGSLPFYLEGVRLGLSDGSFLDMEGFNTVDGSPETQPVPDGQNVVVIFPVGGMSISFGNVTVAGEASVVVMNDPAAPPQGYELIGEAYDITTTAVYDTVAGITVSVPWCGHCLPVFVPWCGHCLPQELEPYLQLMHHEQGEWQHVTTLVDTANGIISGNVSSLSPFSVMLLMDPVAAIEDLVNTVANMNLHKGIHNSLDAKLTNALSALTDNVSGNDASAVNKLNAFINECEAQSGKHLAPEQANKLIVMADAIIQTLMN